SRHDVSALNHNLVPDARPRGIEIDSVLFRERLNRAIFLLVGLVLVLNIVVKGKDDLLRVMDLLCTDALELAHDGGRVVVGHDMERANGDEVSGAKRAIGTFG